LALSTRRVATGRRRASRSPPWLRRRGGRGRAGGIARGSRRADGSLRRRTPRADSYRRLEAAAEVLASPRGLSPRARGLQGRLRPGRADPMARG
jgi:hypothetical protein